MLTTWLAKIIKGGPVVVVTPYHISLFYRQWFKKLGGTSHGRSAVCVKAWQMLSVTCYTCYCCISSDTLLAVVVRSPHKFLYQNFSSYQMCNIRHYGVTAIFSDGSVTQSFVKTDKLCLKLAGTVTDNKALHTSTFCPYVRKVGINTYWVFTKQYSEEDTQKLRPPRKVRTSSRQVETFHLRFETRTCSIDGK
jgi:hypothetical protein